MQPESYEPRGHRIALRLALDPLERAGGSVSIVDAGIVAPTRIGDDLTKPE